MGARKPDSGTEAALRARIHALEAERDALHAVLDRAPAMIALTQGPEHVFVFASEALRTHMGVADPIGRPFRQAAPCWADSPVHEAMDCVFGNGEPAQGVDLTVRGADGPRQLDFALMPIREGETVTGVATFALDAGREGRPGRDPGADSNAHMAAHAIYAAHSRGREAEERRDRQLEVLSHELRSPLHVVMGYLAMLQSEGGDRLPAALRRHIVTCIEATDDLARLVDDLLDLGAARAGTLVLRPRLVDVHDLVESAIAEHGPRAEARGLTVEVAHAPFLPALVADRGRVVQALGKLLDNAIRHTPAGGTIHVRTACQGGWLDCEVADTGTGIPAAALPGLFEPFRALDTSLTREAGSLGVGLALTRAFAEAHGGTVVVDSKPGEGSTFKVRLPVAGPRA